MFDDTLLFDIDKFSGYDRFETGTRANVGLQYTFQANNGIYIRTVFGQSYQLAGENPFIDPGVDPTGKFNYSPVSGLQTNRSDYVAGIYMSPFSRRQPHQPVALRREGLDPAPSGHRPSAPPTVPLTGTAAYTFTAFDPVTGLLDKQQEIMGSIGLKLTNNWSVSGMMRYDIDLGARIQDKLTLKYADECFVLTADYIETFVDQPHPRPEARPHGDAAVRAEAYRRVQLQDRPVDQSFGDQTRDRSSERALTGNVSARRNPVHPDPGQRPPNVFAMPVPWLSCGYQATADGATAVRSLVPIRAPPDTPRPPCTSPPPAVLLSPPPLCSSGHAVVVTVASGPLAAQTPPRQAAAQRAPAKAEKQSPARAQPSRPSPCSSTTSRSPATRSSSAPSSSPSMPTSAIR